MVMLPGGQYALAAVSDGTAHHNHALVVFVMDYGRYGAIPLAKTIPLVGGTVEGSLQVVLYIIQVKDVRLPSCSEGVF